MGKSGELQRGETEPQRCGEGGRREGGEGGVNTKWPFRSFGLPAAAAQAWPRARAGARGHRFRAFFGATCSAPHTQPRSAR